MVQSVGCHPQPCIPVEREKRRDELKFNRVILVSQRENDGFVITI